MEVYPPPMTITFLPTYRSFFSLTRNKKSSPSSTSGLLVKFRSNLLGFKVPIAHITASNLFDSDSISEEVLIDFNKEIINALDQQNCKSQSINSKENNILTVVQENEELGFVGSPTNVDQSIIDKIIADKKVPIIAPLGLDKNDQTYNVNADTAAGYIAKKINARRLIILSDVEGVLDNNKNLIPEINSKSIKNLIDNETISGGMIPKINNCLDVASNGVKGVVIIDGRKNHSLLFELLSDEGSGTLIRQ